MYIQPKKGKTAHQVPQQAQSIRYSIIQIVPGITQIPSLEKKKEMISLLG